MAPTNQRESEVPDGVTRTVFDSMFGYSNGGFGQSYNSGEGAHGWADRLRDYCDQVGGWLVLWGCVLLICLPRGVQPWAVLRCRALLLSVVASFAC